MEFLRHSQPSNMWTWSKSIIAYKDRTLLAITVFYKNPLATNRSKQVLNKEIHRLYEIPETDSDDEVNP